MFGTSTMALIYIFIEYPTLCRFFEYLCNIKKTSCLMNETIKRLKDKILAGGTIDAAEVDMLAAQPHLEELYTAAEEITRRMCPATFDSCSIVNARSGRCSENCKWCAQSAHYNTGCDTYDIIDEELCMTEARYNHSKGVKRFSLVASGRAVKGEALKKICGMLQRIKDEVGIKTCASLGLLEREELQQLWDAGVRRYHCNLEAAPDYFKELCTTHTVDDKIRTINTAREIGFEVCSGGIIGMGETAMQRYQLALKLREVEPESIPVNILCPIPGTPLADARPLTDDEILTTLAIFRFIHPTVQIRFAGGRNKLSRETQLRAMRIAVNGGIVGDLLTTVGSKIDDDRQLTNEAGYEF